MTDSRATDHHQKALLRLLDGLFALVGLVVGGSPVARLPLSVKRQIQRALLPIESAARRLIFFLEQRLPETEPEPEKKPKRSRYNAHTLANQRKNRRDDRRRLGKQRKLRAAVFWLFDKKAYCPFTSDPHKRPPRGGPGPRIWSLHSICKIRTPRPYDGCCAD